MILGLVAWLLYHKLSDHRSLANFVTLMKQTDRTDMFVMLSVLFLLMLVNYLIESIKWRFLCQPFEAISLWRSLESVFCGLTWAIFTPNRVGEYGGRVLFLPPRKRVFGVVAMGIGALAQVVITNIVGSLSLCWFLGRFLQVHGWLNGLMWLAGLLYSGAFLLLYFRVSLLNRLLNKLTFLKKFLRFFNLLSQYQPHQLTRIFAYSLLRVGVYTSQYALLMQMMIPALPFFPMLAMIFLLYFAQTLLPTLDLFDFGVRSLTASYFFGFITTQEVAVMASASCIWFINLIFPALVGSVFVLKINFFETAPTISR
ncbi:hypothetical protein SAMN05216436_101185 [bacterium A37T11]|nr:hypothetical protein SAMN05216436_101185 [bacterium A37T11]